MGSTSPETEVEINGGVNGHLLQDNVQNHNPVAREDDVNNDVSERSPCCSYRWIIGYMGLIVGTLKNVLQVNISIVIVCMVGSDSNIFTNVTSNVTSSDYSHDVTSSASMYEHVQVINVTNFTPSNTARSEGGYIANMTSQRDSANNMYDQLKTIGEFDWDIGTQSAILSAFYYGYMCTLIPFGWLASIYGGKHVLSITFLVSAVVTILTPVLARTHAYFVVATRVIIGASLAACSPAWMALIGVWSLPTERTRFVSLYWIGQLTGTVIGLMTSGYLCVVGFDNGWASVFYIHGGSTLLLTLAMQWLVYSNPDEHPRISIVERRLLAKALRGNAESKKEKPMKTPWCSIMTSLPAWAIFSAHFANNWSYYLLLTCLPLFTNDVLHFDIKSNGLLSSLPFITLGVSTSFTGPIADGVASKHWLSLTMTRKIFQVIGCIGTGVFIVVCGYVSQRELVIVCLCVSMFFNAIGQSGGFSANLIDIAPRLSAVVYAISNTIACIPGILAPVIVAAITQNKTLEEWRYVFYLCAAISLGAAIIYVLVSSSELAPWAVDASQDASITVNRKPGDEELHFRLVEKSENGHNEKKDTLELEKV